MHRIKPLLTRQIPVFKSNLRFNQKLLCLHNLVIISEEQKAIISHSYTLPFKKSFNIDYIGKMENA